MIHSEILMMYYMNKYCNINDTLSYMFMKYYDDNDVPCCANEVP